MTDTAIFRRQPISAVVGRIMKTAAGDGCGGKYVAGPLWSGTYVTPAPFVSGKLCVR